MHKTKTLFTISTIFFALIVSATISVQAIDFVKFYSIQKAPLKTASLILSRGDDELVRLEGRGFKKRYTISLSDKGLSDQDLVTITLQFLGKVYPIAVVPYTDDTKGSSMFSIKLVKTKDHKCSIRLFVGNGHELVPVAEQQLDEDPVFILAPARMPWLTMALGAASAARGDARILGMPILSTAG